MRFGPSTSILMLYKGWLITEQWRADGLTDQVYLEQLSAKLDAILAV